MTLADGTYRIAVTMADGRRVWRRARSQRAAERIRRELVDERDLDLDPGRRTLADWLRSWIAELAEARNARVRPTTLRHYRGIVEGHLIPGLDPAGRLPLARLSERRIQAWIDAEVGSARSLHHYRAVLRRALNVAVRRRVIARNPAIGVELPVPRTDAARPLDADEVRRLLAATRDDRLGPLWRLAVVSGLRESELLGLAWDDLDADGVTVTTQLQRLISEEERAAARAEGRRPVGSWVRGPTKAARRLAHVALDPETLAMLERHRRRMADERTVAWRYYGHVFVTERGDPYHGRRIVDEFHAACDRAGIPRRRVHDLRATAATLMREAGVAEDARMARLGHSTTDMARRYARASEAQDRAAVARLAERIG